MNKTQVRRESIVAILRDQGSLTVVEIMERFGVSEATARRDLETLESDKKLIRTFGGAVLETVRSEIPFYHKMELQTEEKKEIAVKAVERIRDGDVIGLTGGSTTMFVAKRILQLSYNRLTVVTNALNIAFELAGTPGIELIVTGGANRTQSYELSGPMADASLSRVTIQKTFIGADGVDLERGLTTFDELEAHTNQMMIRQSSETYVLADHTKLGARSLFQIEGWGPVTALITDRLVSAQTKKSFTEAGIALV